MNNQLSLRIKLIASLLASPALPSHAETDRLEDNDKAQQNQRTAAHNKPSEVAQIEAPKVVMYSADWCGYCKRARAYLKDKNIPFTEYDVERDYKGQRDYQRMNGSVIPLITIDGQRLHGWNRGRFDKAYDNTKG